NAFVALPSKTHRPADCGVRANLTLPLRADFGQIIGPDEGGAAAIGPVHDGDIGVGQVYTGIELFQGRIVPFFNLAEEDVRQDRARELELGVYALDVVSGNHAAEHSGKVQHVEIFDAADLLVGHGHVGGAEINGARAQLFDAAARSNGLVVDLYVGMRLPVLLK